MEMRELHSILNIDGNDYKVNAEHSVAAAKVDNALKINQVNINDESVSNQFDGSEAQEISIVSSEGGTFSGPIAVKSREELLEELLRKLSLELEDLENLENIESVEDLEKKEKLISLKETINKLVLNYGDISTMIQELTGHPCLQWDGTELKTELMADDFTIQKVSLITGTFADYNAFISQEEKPIFFLYICTDNGQVFFGLDKENYRQVGAKALKLVYEDDQTETEKTGFTAEDLKEHAETLAAITNENNGILAQAKDYTDGLADGLETLIDNNADEIQLIVDTIQGTVDNPGIIDRAVAAAKEYTDLRTTTKLFQGLDEWEEADTASVAGANYVLVKSHEGRIEELEKATNEETGILAAAKEYTKSRTTTRVFQGLGKWEEADTASLAGANYVLLMSHEGRIADLEDTAIDAKINKLKDDLVAGEVTVGKATKATKDASGNTFTNYYQKKITVSDEIPKNSEGANGDIWITYLK